MMERVETSGDSSIKVVRMNDKASFQKEMDGKFVDGLGFGSLGWGKSKKVVVGEGNGARHYEVYLPGYHNMDDLEASSGFQSKVMEEDAYSLFDLYRHQMEFESYQSLRFQVDTLITYGVNDLKRTDPEYIRVAIEKAKADLEQDDDTCPLKDLIDQYLLVNGRHYSNAALLRDKEGALYDIAKKTILELVENASRDILEEIESRGTCFEFTNFGDDEEVDSVDLCRLRKTLNVLIQKKVDYIWKMEEHGISRKWAEVDARRVFDWLAPQPLCEQTEEIKHGRCLAKEDTDLNLDSAFSWDIDPQKEDDVKHEYNFIDTGYSLVVPRASSINLPPSLYNHHQNPRELVIYCRLRSGKLTTSPKETRYIMQDILNSARELQIDFRNCSEENAKKIWVVSVKFRERSGGRWISLRDEIQRIISKKKNVRVDESDESDDAMDILAYYMGTTNI